MQSFGDLSYLLKERFDAALAAQARAATRVALPPGLPTGAKGVPKQGGAIPWVQGLPKGGAHLLLYTREEYQDLSRPLGSSAGSKCRHRPICPPGASWGSRRS